MLLYIERLVSWIILNVYTFKKKSHTEEKNTVNLFFYFQLQKYQEITILKIIFDVFIIKRWRSYKILANKDVVLAKKCWREIQNIEWNFFNFFYTCKNILFLLMICQYSLAMLLKIEVHIIIIQLYLHFLLTHNILLF